MKEEKRLGLVRLSSYEAAMIAELRKHDFGTWTITKTDGEPRRIVQGGSEMLSADIGEQLFED